MANAADPHFQALQLKYRPVLKLMEQCGVRLRTLDMDGGKLLLRAEMPSEALRQRVWDEIKEVDPSYSDLIADIAAADGVARTHELYTVQPGDSLRSIADEYYGDANAYVRIWTANRDQLTDPDELRPGQRLILPVE